MKVTIDMTPAQLEVIIREYLSRNGFKEVGSVSFEVREIETGNQMHPHKQHKLTNVKCEVKMEEVL